MEMWQWVMLFGAVSLNTIVNVWRLYLDKQKKIQSGPIAESEPVRAQRHKLGSGSFVGLSRVREKEGYTQLKLAQALGKSQALISKVEVGRGQPSNKVIFSMAELFGKSVDELMTEILDATEQIKKAQKMKRI